MINQVTISTYKIKQWRSGRYNVMDKVQEMIYDGGINKIYLDNTDPKFVNFINYNRNNTRVVLKSTDGQKYNPINNIFYKYPEGLVISPRKVFTTINVRRKRQLPLGIEHFCMSPLGSNCSTYVYIAVLLFILYLIQNKSKINR